MSSVLSPVGPQPVRTYWIRRLLVLGAPLILIIVIAVSCSGGSKKPSASSNAPGETPTTATTSDGDTVCAPSDLSAQISTSETVYGLGDSPVFTGVLTNISAATCQLTTSPANEIWTVITGPDRFWTTGPSAGCPASGTPTTKLLAPGSSHAVTITWDGKRLEPGCTSGDAAAAGTYHLQAKLDGVRAEPVTFAFHSDA